ncbi:hypothetical protein BX600DRAFT_466880 [Xylariales sp. PMI_506]|nr:hypothetical protein BX600DRAFT_466880 [Xylariales sp. PMI_506]
MSATKLTVTTPLCLLEAWSACYHEHRIDQEEYHYHALAHLAGVVHDEDLSDDNKIVHTLGVRDCFLYSIRDVAKEIQPINGM